MKKIVIHSAVWLILVYSLFFSLTIFLPVKVAAYRSVAGIMLMAGIFYFSGWVLANEFLIKRRNLVLFIIFELIAIFVFSVLRVRILGLLPGDAAFFSNRFSEEKIISPDNLKWGRDIWQYNRLGTGRGPFLIGLIMNSVLSIIAVLLRLYENKDKKERESREELQRSQEAQILYLKSQVNPHFLFNTLNNLYGLTYSKSDLAPQMVLGLSDTMRYLIYETEQKLVPVEKELNFIHNYLDLEKTRISYPENIRVSVQVRNLSVFIPPLLLLPFIENCFKHGTIGKEDDGWIELDIWDENDNFFFICKNNFTENKTGKSPGIGLANVKKRLQLIFGERYELRTVKQNNEFMVSLQFPVFAKKEML
ncbi:hypothetical protein GM418_23135 [Maribellus comscasis]|jgi:hypothetical protein|uniref:Signal transduction histidine kinase internal region domain-containing protein n=1 Tax=Maribellus comscasis TaxID=2681766 RepID=A0A6I6JZ73_9BACT|nr:histidine kinase [Maribellus comscasis]QGY46450.1 hypothetical protein GM418_23135 [Maribellus comscasis]